MLRFITKTQDAMRKINVDFFVCPFYAIHVIVSSHMAMAKPDSKRNIDGGFS